MSFKKISKKAIRNGLNSGKIQIVGINGRDPHIQIGDMVIAVFGSEYEDVAPEKMYEAASYTGVVDMIYSEINSDSYKRTTLATSPEWEYFKTVLEGA